MRSFTNTFNPLASVFMLAAATGCAASSSVIPQPTSGAPSAASAARVHAAKKATRGLLYVADYDANEIRVFQQTTNGLPTPKYAITDGISSPYGITTDSAGNLYVANDGSGTVTIYAPRAKKPKETLRTGLTFPTDVAVDAAGDVFVSSNADSGSPYVSYFAAGATSPSFTWQSPLSGWIGGIALVFSDGQGLADANVYATLDYYPSGSGTDVSTVLACVPLSSQCQNLGFTLGPSDGIALENPPLGSQPFDYLVADQSIPGYDNIENNSEITKVPTGYESPAYLAFNSDRSELYISYYSRVIEYAYPSMQAINTYYIGEAQALGVACAPGGTFYF